MRVGHCDGQKDGGGRLVEVRGGHRRLYGMTSAEENVGILAKRAVGDSHVVCRINR